MENKKIAIVVPLLRKGGGAEKIASWLSRELAGKGYIVHVITFWNRENEHEIGGTRHNVSGGLLGRVLGIKKIARETGIDTVISFTEEASVACVFSRIFGLKGKLVLAVRNNPVVRGFMPRLFIRLFYPKADLVVANSKGMAKILENRFGLKKVSVIHNPVDVEKNRKLAERPLSKEIEEKLSGKFVFLNIGRLIDQKNQAWLIDTFAEVAKENSNVMLVILGGGILYDNLILQIKNLKLEDRVMLGGIVENVYPYLKRADCFVLSSKFEGFPNVILDAMSLGKKTISTDCESGPRELLAPNLNLDEKVEYPYSGDFGVLVCENGNVLEEAMSEVQSLDNSNMHKTSGKTMNGLTPEEIMNRWFNVVS